MSGAYAEVVGWTAVLEVAEGRWRASLDAVLLGKIIYDVLLTKTEGKAFSIVHLTPRRAGAEAWRLQHREHAGSSGARLANMVRDVVCPREHWLSDVNAGKDFLTSLIEWEIKVAAYEDARVVTRSAKQCGWRRSWVTPLEQKRNVNVLKLWMRESSYATPGLFQGSVPMQVGAVNDGGWGKKRKSKMTRDKSKGTGKGKEKSKHKRSDSGTSKERDVWIGGQQQVQFQGYCSHCSKWGRKHADCRTRLAQQKYGAVAGNQEPEAEGDGVKSVQWCDVDSDTYYGTGFVVLVFCNHEYSKGA